MENSEIIWTGSPDDMTAVVNKQEKAIVGILQEIKVHDDRVKVLRVDIESRQNIINGMKEHLNKK